MSPVVPPPLIDCIDCGGRCHLMVTWANDDPREAGDIVTYRCSDCLDVWYIELAPNEDGGEDGGEDPVEDPVEDGGEDG